VILLIDNYDSFTYNIYQALAAMDQSVWVVRNDRVTLEEIREKNPSHIIISPGPGRPEEAGIVVEAIRFFQGRIPILGICLGHQAIGVAFGARVIPADRIMHGRESQISHDGRELFRGLPSPFRAVRYHSLVLEKRSIPRELSVTALSEDGAIMGIRHTLYSIEGVQFHPESIGTREGIRILKNFVQEERPQPVIRQSIRRLSRGDHLSREQAAALMEEIAAGNATGAQIAAVLTALSLKGEGVEEIAGFASVLRRRALTVERPEGISVIDTCGTGGDMSGTFNISTTAALVTAAAGCVVAKHGNRSVTSRCGSADLMEALGVGINNGPDQIQRILREVGIGFLFAPGLHPSMKYAAGPRREIGIRTIFNILGPLANPVGADAQLVGVFHPALTERIAKVLVELGVRRAMVVHGLDGLDEITLTGETRISEVREGWIHTYRFHPREVGLQACRPADLRGGQLKKNAEITLEILQGKKGPRRDVVLLNAAAAIYLDGKARDLREGIRRAARAIDDRRAMAKLEDLIRVSNGK